MNDGFSTLIGVDELVAHRNDADWVIVDCRFTLGDPKVGETAFGKSRIPGARYAHLERDLSGPRHARSGRNPLPEPDAFAETLARLGITPRSQVVVYDDSFGSIACRLWWLLRRAGHRQVALLDGGWPVWKRKKAPIDEAPAAAAVMPAAAAVMPAADAVTPAADAVTPAADAVTPAADAVTPAASPYPIDNDDALLADAALVEAIRLDPAWALIDARPEERYSGERESVDPVGGHIPGSRNWNYEDNLALDGRFLAPGELRDNFLGLLGDRPATRVVHTCGSGVSACHNLLAMEHAGLHGSRLYAGSWSEWITDPARPVAVGFD